MRTRMCVLKFLFDSTEDLQMQTRPVGRIHTFANAKTLEAALQQIGHYRAESVIDLRQQMAEYFGGKQMSAREIASGFVSTLLQYQHSHPGLGLQLLYRKREHFFEAIGLTGNWSQAMANALPDEQCEGLLG